MKNTELVMFEKTIQNDENFIFIKPLCDFFGINHQRQYGRIQNDVILARSLTKKSKMMTNGRTYPRICLDKKGFIRWIQIINPNIVAIELRESFINYQEMVFDYLYGAAEENNLIGKLNKELQEMKQDYSRIGSEIRNHQVHLTDALNKRYQYQLPFEATT